MPNTSMQFETVVNAPIEKAFEYVSDLTRHGEWAGNTLEITAVSPTIPISTGKKYRSHAEVKGLTFDAELTVTAFETPSRFGFAGEDSTGKFEHLFAFTAVSPTSTKITRTIQFDLNLKQWLMFALLYFPVRRPAAQKAMQQLKAKLEQ